MFAIFKFNLAQSIIKDPVISGFKGCDRVGEVPGPRLKRHAVYRVGEVVLVPLVPPNLVPGDVPLSHQLGLKPCPKHHGGKLIYHLCVLTHTYLLTAYLHK